MAVRLPLDPMLARKVDYATAGAAVLARTDLAFEPKWDGYRMIVEVDRGYVRLWSRSKRSVTDEFPEIAEQFIDTTPAVYDGEVVVFDPVKNAFSFNALQNVQRLSRDERRARVKFVAFDLLGCDDDDMIRRRSPYHARRELLEAVIRGTSGPILSPTFRDGQALWDGVVATNGEGVIAKPLDSPYRMGERGTWMKLKAVVREEFRVIGWTSGWSEASNGPLPFGAVILGDEAGRFAGKAGTGFTDVAAAALLAQLREIELAGSPFDPAETKRVVSVIAPGPREVHWCEPELRCVVEFSDRVGEYPRFPSWKGLAS